MAGPRLAVPRPRLRRLKFEEEVSVVDHLDELRTRLLVSIGSLVVAFAFAFWQHGEILELLNRQLPDTVGQPTTLGVTEPFMIALQVSLYTAFLIALPIVFYQVYAFVVPAFREEHQGALWPMLIFVPSLFTAGAAFGYFLVVPAAIEFLQNFDNELYDNQLQAIKYYPFVVKLMVALGVVFEVPAAILMLTRVGIVDYRFLARNRKYAVLISAVVAALMPGQDPGTMVLILLPLLVLYEISIQLSRIFAPRRATVGDALADL
jgi:sec-independent protein translocase protein TatC